MSKLAATDTASKLAFEPAPGKELGLDVELWLLAVRRVGYSPLAYPVFAVVIAGLTPLGSEQPLLVLLCSLGLALTAVLRIWHVRHFGSQFARRAKLHQFLFRFGALLCGFVLSLLCSAALSKFGITPTTLVCLLVLAGLVSGGTASLAADGLLVRAFVVVSLLPPVFTCLSSGPGIPPAVPYAILSCLLFYIALSVQMSSQAKELLLHARTLREQKAELTLAKSKAEAAVVAKGAFLATMSHELRTPLNGVIGMTELLQGTSLDATQRDYVGTLSTTADALLSLVNDILDFSKIESGKLELEQIPFDLSRLVHSVVDLMQPQAARKSVGLTVEVAPSLQCWWRGDPTRLRQMLLNLLGNAVKFTDVGSVKLRVEVDREAPSRICFSVVDTGVGIPPEKQREIFEEFSQVDSSTTRKHGGTGLGLAITRRLAQAMGSAVQLASELGRGSTFSFSVELEVALAPAVPSNPPLAPSIARPLHILVVDDNLVNLKVATRLLERLGCTVQTAGNGLEACEKYTDTFDAVLMDCMMPVLDGYEATCRLRAHGVRVPIYAMTANCQPEDIVRSKQAGMNGHLSKPIRLAELAQTLNGAGAA